MATIAPFVPGSQPADSTTQNSSQFPDPIPHIIPAGSLNILAGAGGVGKTTFMAELAVRLRDGRSVCGYASNRQSSLGIITSDRKWKSHRLWFAAAGWPDIPHFSLRDLPGFDWESLNTTTKRKDLLNRGLDSLKLEPGGFVLIDPLATFLPGRMIDYHSMLRGLGMIDGILGPRKLTAFCTGHTGKQKANPNDRWLRPQDRLLGSTALVGFVDTTLYILSPQETDQAYYEFGWIPHNSPEGTFKLVRDTRTGLFIPYRDGQTGESDLDRPMKLLELIPVDGIKTMSLVELAQENFKTSKSTTLRDLKQLRTHGMIFEDELGFQRRRKVQ